MNWAAWISWSLALLCLAAAVHPFSTYPLSLSILARWRAKPVRQAPPAWAPSVAVCVCAYNEQAVIAARVNNILAARYAGAMQVLVYVDAATDATNAILHGFGDRITVVHPPARLGKTSGMNTLVGMARADIVVFTDANVEFAPDAVARLVAPFADPEVGCVCGHLRYRAAVGETAATGSLYWRLEEHIKALESATGSVIGADGSIFAIRRSQHVPAPPHLIDDMFVSLSLLCHGVRVVRAADAAAFEDSVATTQEEFHRKIRIACQAFNVHRALWPSLRGLPALDLYKYLSHKFLRWLTALWLAGAVLFTTAGLALAGAWTLLALFMAMFATGCAMLGLARRGAAARLREIAAAFLATALGVGQSIRGRSFQTWTPPASARGYSAMTGGA